jgi:hypothetical protein
VPEDIAEAERKLLDNAPSDQAVPTPTLLRKVEHENPRMSGDTVRHAYWDLVNRGVLQRSSDGVRKLER